MVVGSQQLKKEKNVWEFKKEGVISQNEKLAIENINKTLVYNHRQLDM